jgi:hypothetical protein
MKKVVLATFLACAAVASSLPFASAQDASSGAQAPAAPAGAGAPIQLPPAEYQVWNNANTQTDPAARAAALDAYLTQFPQSTIKENVLETIMALYAPINAAKAADAADRLLVVDPNNLKGLYIETLVHKGQADSITDPTAKQAALDSAASYAQKGLAATKPAGVSDADFNTEKTNFYPGFYSAIGYDAFSKKDSATAIDAFKKELGFVSLDATKTPGPVLQDTFYLSETYLQATPPDYLNCAFYASRAVAYAPDSFKNIMSPTAKYCYRKYHGADDGYDAVVAAATANLFPPADFSTSVKPAPTPADIVNQVIASTPDLATLAPGDKEFILQNGTPDQAAKVWDTVKGKSVELPGVLVIASTPTQVQVAVSDDAVQGKTADFTFNLTPPEDIPEPKAGATAVQKAAYTKKVAAAKKLADDTAAATQPGKTVTLDGTYASFTPNPIMIIMSDGVVVLQKAAAPKAPVHHTAAH